MIPTRKSELCGQIVSGLKSALSHVMDSSWGSGWAPKVSGLDSGGALGGPKEAEDSNTEIETCKGNVSEIKNALTHSMAVLKLGLWGGSKGLRPGL